MDTLYKSLYELFKNELIELNIGYPYNRKRLYDMIDIINAIEFLTWGQYSNTEAITIVKNYE